MTAQVPDKLINEHPRVDFGDLQLYGIIAGDIRPSCDWPKPFRLPTPPSPPANAATSSAWWRGYIATFRLNPDGTLDHLCYEYSLSSKEWVPQSVNDRLTGDFWLDMRPHFDDKRTYVLFRDGHVVEDRDQWYTQPDG
jgi:hypothetical protein